jgi:RNA recognition motif-containing protein
LKINIFVAKLDFNIQGKDLINAFTPYVEVASANVIMDKSTGRSKGFGSVEMENNEEAKKAIEALNDTELQGRTMVVKKAEPRKEREKLEEIGHQQQIVG